METLIIQVDCRPYARDGPPQLGITVEAPFSQQRSQQQIKKQQSSPKEYQNHDYQNLDRCSINLTTSDGGSIRLASSSNATKTTRDAHSSLRNRNKQHVAGVFNRPQFANQGLQITQIQPGSVIDRNGQFKVGDILVECNGVNLQRPFAEAQKTLKQFVVEHTSHGPLVLKVLRKAASSSSIPSTTGSQITVIERNEDFSNDPLFKYTEMLKPKQIHSQPEKPSSSSTSTSPKSPASSKASRHLVDALNTRKIGVKHTIKLKKGPQGGFGIKIAERDNMHSRKSRPIYITAITTSGSAYRDGQLQEGDMLLKVNGYDLQGKSQPEVTKMLKEIGSDQEVEFVISRQEFTSDHNHSEQRDDSIKNIENDCDKSLIDLDVIEHDDSVFESSNRQFERKIDSLLNIPIKDGPGLYVYDIPLNDTKSAGLGLYLKYPKRADEQKDLGIWIEKVITGGAAWKDGRLQPNDQILAINGINLIGLSNAEASETLTAAVCRGIGPEATPNTIKLQIHRRDQQVVAKILQGTDNRIECSDIIANQNQSCLIIENSVDNSSDSYRTARDKSMHTKNENRYSSDSSNQNDSAMSPQTQASNSIKLTNSYFEKSDHNSSDKTNDTSSSAISLSTDVTNNVPIHDANNLVDQQCDNNLLATTRPKSIHTDVNADLQIYDCTSSSQSLDEESADTTAGEDRFQRDGFGRQSMSEKRHAQLNAKNTDTYKRNQRLRDEREQQRQLEEQLARQRLDDDRTRSYQLTNQRIHASYTTDEFKSIYGLQTNINIEPEERLVDGFHREVPVDVHLQVDPHIKFISNGNCKIDQHVYNQDRLRYNQAKTSNSGNGIAHINFVDSCPKCGMNNRPCLCDYRNQESMQNHSQHYDQNLKRSNSLESVQQHQIRDDLVIPRAGTVRVARNRKVNESFRAAVDRSYESSTNKSNSQHEQSEPVNRNQVLVGTRMSGSLANSTGSTSNEEHHLISCKNAVSNPSTHKKSSSLLTKFLKFGSIKRKKKNKTSTELIKPIETRPSASKSNREHDKTQPKNSHARTHSSQSHPNLNNHQCDNSAMKSDVMLSSQMYSSGMERPTTMMNGNHNTHQYHASLESQTLHNRASMPMCHQHYQTVHDNNTHYNKIPAHVNQASGGQAKLAPTMTMMTQQHLGNNVVGHHQQYSQAPLYQSNQQRLLISPVGPIVPNDMSHNQNMYSTHRNHIVLNPHIVSNRTSNDYQQQAQRWQSSQHQPHNGLWVSNSPMTDNQMHANNGIYGTIPQHMNNQQPVNIQRPLHQRLPAPAHQPPATHNLNGATYHPLINGTANGMQQISTMRNNFEHNLHVPFNQIQSPPTMQNHHQATQQIYYYDF